MWLLNSLNKPFSGHLSDDSKLQRAFTLRNLIPEFPYTLQLREWDNVLGFAARLFHLPHIHRVSSDQSG